MGHPVQRFAALAVFALLAACASGPGKKTIYGEPNPHYKVGKPYQVNGEWYVPETDTQYDRIGFASWYGPGFHGRLTANGEVFDENRLTAAHPTLPLPSIIEVTNPKNGKRLTLRVNDRGPFANNRILDLSKEAARQLGTKEQGVATVRVRYIGAGRIEDAITTVGERERGQALYAQGPRMPVMKPVSPLATETDMILADLDVSILDGHHVRTPVAVNHGGGGSLFVQLGAFSSTDNAAAAASRIPGDQPVALEGAVREGRPLTLVRLGPFAHPLSAEEALETARNLGFSGAYIIEEALR